MILKRYNPSGNCPQVKSIDLSLRPCPTIMAGGVWGDNLSHYWLEEGGMGTMKQRNDGKPTYRVPSMDEVAALPKHGLKVVSTALGALATLLVVTSGLGILAVALVSLAAILVVPAILVVGAAVVDPILVAVTEDGYWIEIDRWWS